LFTIDVMKLPQSFASPPRTFVSGATIFKAGDDAREMFVVESGEVDLIVNGEIVETVGPDGFFGELALIDDSTRSADAVARSDCRLLTLTRHRFLFMVDEIPLFALQVMKGMADRLRMADKRAKVRAKQAGVAER
jgi:CRP-like cAMP-binding protein